MIGVASVVWYNGHHELWPRMPSLRYVLQRFLINLPVVAYFIV
jgi:hypothetical protein